MTSRRIFLHSLINFLNTKNYCLLKFTHQTLDELPLTSDLDIAVDKQTLKSTIHWIDQHKDIKKILKLKKSYMHQLWIFFKDDSFLAIDLINDFIRKTTRYMNCSFLLKNAIEKNGLRKAHSTDDFLYTLCFYTLNTSSIPIRYQEYFSSLPIHEQDQIKKYICNHIHNIDQINTLFEYSPDLHSTLLKSIKNLSTSWSFPSRAIKYFKDSFFSSKAFPIFSFSGVDGAGKSTIIEETKEILKNAFRLKVKVLRQRPGFLPILSSYIHGKKKAEQFAATRLPRQGNNKSIISSLIRFFYYLIDYQIGQIVMFFKYSKRGYIILYDRYYFDFIADGRRNNLNLNSRFFSPFYSLIYHPRSNFFLFAPPEVILKRKQELSGKDIELLTENYKSIFFKYDKKFKESYRCIENINKEKTLNTVKQSIINTF